MFWWDIRVGYFIFDDLINFWIWCGRDVWKGGDVGSGWELGWGDEGVNWGFWGRVEGGEGRW